MGLKRLRKPYVSVPLSMKDAKGRHVPLSRRAQCSAEFLATVIWGETSPAPQKLIDKISDERLVTVDLRMNLRDIDPEELRAAIRKLKRGGAAGPDCIPIDIFKELDHAGQMMILRILNQLWNGEEIPQDILQAQVVLICI